MTCIVGIETRTGIIMGGDSCTSDGYAVRVLAGDKVFKVGPYLVGIAGSGRVSDILRYMVQWPDPPQRGLHRFMVQRVVPVIRKSLGKGGHMLTGTPPGGEGPSGGDALDSAVMIGVHGRVFTLTGELCVDDHAEGYAASGSGGMTALGSLHSTVGMNPRARVRKALEAAEAHAIGVRRPWRIMSL